MIEDIIARLSVPCWGKSILEIDDEHRKIIDLLKYLHSGCESEMTPNEYQAAALRTANKDLSQMEQLQNGVMGLTGEAGECADLLKKHLFQGHKLDKDHLAKELGDVAWYLSVSANALGYELEEVFQMNIDKLKARYPEGFDPDLSVHRKTDDI